MGRETKNKTAYTQFLVEDHILYLKKARVLIFPSINSSMSKGQAKEHTHAICVVYSM
jgi:hypothetical protein